MIRIPSIEVLQHNSNGDYPISAASQKTLFYCPRLNFVPSENLLTANYNNLERVILFGDIVREDVLLLSEHYYPGKFPHARFLVFNKEESKHVDRIKMQNNFIIKEVFRDIELEWFDKK